jgi:hypothetical protein
MTTETYCAWRGASIALGLAAAALGCYGAWDYALQLEGKVSYLVLAAPVIGAAAAIIPPLAEWCWHEGMRLKAFLWCLVLIPAAATVFFGATERVHLAKAGAEAERGAQRQAVIRAEQELAEARKEKPVADKGADKYAALKDADCPPRGKCQIARAAKQRADSRLQEAEKALKAAESAALAESDLKAPPWLLPLSLDLVAFMAIWSGLTGPRPRRMGDAPRPVETPSQAGRAPKVAEEITQTDPAPTPPKKKRDTLHDLQRKAERQAKKNERRREQRAAKRAEAVRAKAAVSPLRAAT